jgi:predicted phage-related endonuclease
MLTEAQLKARAGKITSSIAAGALGLTPQTMSQIKAWQAATGDLPPVDTKATERGNRLEQIVLDYPADELSLARKTAPFRQHPNHPWAGDSADALYLDGDDLVLVGEGKTAAMGMARRYGEEDTDEIPESALVQSHWHLIHWPEVERCVVPVLVGGWKFEFRLYYVDRDMEFEGAILQELEQWHRDYVVTGKPPPVTSSEHDREWLLGQFPRGMPGRMLADTPEIERWARDKAAAAEDKKAAEQREDEAKNQLRALLGEFEGVKAGWGSVSYKNNKASAKIDWQALALHLGATPEQQQQFTIAVPGPRVLRVTVKN